MSDPGFLEVLVDAIDKYPLVDPGRDQIRAALRALVAYRQDPPAATKLWVEQRIASALANTKLSPMYCADADGKVTLAFNPSEPPKSSLFGQPRNPEANPPATPVSSPSEWAQARERLRDATEKAQACLSRVCSEQSYKLRVGIPARPGYDDDLVLAEAMSAARALLALGDPAPAGSASELPLLRELYAILGRRRAIAEQSAETMAFSIAQQETKALIARASAQAGGKS